MKVLRRFVVIGGSVQGQRGLKSARSCVLAVFDLLAATR